MQYVTLCVYAVHYKLIVVQPQYQLVHDISYTRFAVSICALKFLQGSWLLLNVSYKLRQLAAKMPSAVVIPSGSAPHLLLAQMHPCLVPPEDQLTSPWCCATMASGYTCFAFCQHSFKIHISVNLSHSLQHSPELLSSAHFDVILFKN